MREPDPKKRMEVLEEISQHIPDDPVAKVGEINRALAMATQIGTLISPVQAVDYIPQMHAVSFRYVFMNWEVTQREYKNRTFHTVIGDCYKANFCGDDELALSQQGVLALWRAAGGRDVKVERLDDRTDPLYAEVQVHVALRGIDGKEVDKIKSREVDLRPGSPEAKSMTDRQLGQAQQMVSRNAETKAGLRAIRAALDLQQKYSLAKLERPFIIPVLVPLLDTSDPVLRRLVGAHALGVVSELYGAANSTRALPSAGEAVEVTGGTVDSATGEYTEAEVVEPDDGYDELPPESEADASPACACPCGCGAKLSEADAEKSTSMIGDARCLRCFPGSRFNVARHQGDLQIPKRPGYTAEQHAEWLKKAGRVMTGTEYRIAHLADTHISEARRPEDTARVLDAFCEQAREAKVDLIVHAGDFFDRKSTPAERNLLADWLVEAASIAPVVGVKGNHDADGDLEVFGRLGASHPIVLASRATWVPQAGPFDVFCLPWFTSSHFAAQLDADDRSAGDRAIAAARSLLDTVRHGANERKGSSRIPILVGHCLVAGSETSTGQTLIGHTVELSPADLRETGCEYVALGHVHKRQGWYGNVWYSGSTERCNFGEPEEKSWTLATFRNGRLSEVEHVPLPARRIVLIDAEVADGLVTEALVGVGPGDLVRYRYRVRPEELHTVDEEYLRRRILECGAHDVKLEPVLVHEARVRSEEIANAQSTWDRVVAYWCSKGIEVDEAQRERVRAILDRIEAGKEEVTA